jgi:hypothetical protein
VLRLATRGQADPERVARDTLSPLGIDIRSIRETRVTVEDAFVSMVREDMKHQEAEKAA